MERARREGFFAVTVACEPAGSWWLHLQRLCEDRGIAFVCVQPLVTHIAREQEDYTRRALVKHAGGRPGELTTGQAHIACAAAVLRWIYALNVPHTAWDPRIACGAIPHDQAGAATTAPMAA